MVRCLACVAVLLLAGGAQAAPCSGVDRHPLISQAMSPAIAGQLGVKSLAIRQALWFGGWSVLEVAVPHGEPAFLFYRGDPAASRYLTLWAGAAAPSEEAAIRDWAVANAPGIPPVLAACFAAAVMPGSRR